MSKKEVKLGRRPSADPKEAVRVWVHKSVVKKLGKVFCQDVAAIAINEEYKKVANVV